MNINWFNTGVKQGWIEPYEQELVRFLESCYGELSESEKLIAVFSSLFLKMGHVCLPMDLTPGDWMKVVDADPDRAAQIPDDQIDESLWMKSAVIGGADEEKPFIAENGSIRIRRYYIYEKQIAEWITGQNRAESLQPVEVDPSHFKSLFKDTGESPDWQQVAVALSAVKPFLIISGGPGTGKTTTVARILATHLMSREEPLRIALAAPTGKAAGRMAESLHSEIEKLDLPDDKRAQLPKEAGTLHRLLYGMDSGGLLPETEKPKLRHDLIIVDEASMIDLNLMYKLISNTGNKTRLILLGDKDQLASVEAGSVFADLCQKPANGFLPETAEKLAELLPEIDLPVIDQSLQSDSVIYLTKSYRFDASSGIGRLAAIVKSGKANQNKISELMESDQRLMYDAFDFSREKLEQLAGNMTERVRHAQNVHGAEQLLRYWKKLAWLTVLRRGPEGSDELNRLTERMLMLQRIAVPENGWYHGRPVMITRNSYSLGVFNGDLGVCAKDPEGNLWVWVESGSEIKKLKPNRLTDYSPAYFLTVHKSQGSEFDRVHLLLPRRDTPVLSRELLYTAITRARHSFSLHGSIDLFMTGIGRETVRYTGLKEWII
jgi:exodeoxyribonuclease V alpha subunit